jgi:hypothetical protein
MLGKEPGYGAVSCIDAGDLPIEFARKQEPCVCELQFAVCV